MGQEREARGEQAEAVRRGVQGAQGRCGELAGSFAQGGSENAECAAVASGLTVVRSRAGEAARGHGRIERAGGSRAGCGGGASWGTPCMRPPWRKRGESAVGATWPPKHPWYAWGSSSHRRTTGQHEGCPHAVGAWGQGAGRSRRHCQRAHWHTLCAAAALLAQVVDSIMVAGSRWAV